MFDLQSTLDSSAAAIEALRREFPLVKILAIAVDVTDAELVQTAVVRAAGELSSIDILLCFAGLDRCLFGSR